MLRALVKIKKKCFIQCLESYLFKIVSKMYFEQFVYLWWVPTFYFYKPRNVWKHFAKRPCLKHNIRIKSRFFWKYFLQDFILVENQRIKKNTYFCSIKRVRGLYQYKSGVQMPWKALLTTADVLLRGAVHNSSYWKKKNYWTVNKARINSTCSRITTFYAFEQIFCLQ